MPNSQNGWPVLPGGYPFVVNGVTFGGGVRAGNVHTVLEYVAERYARTVESLVAGQCGGFNARRIGSTNVWSNHASGTAIDINWREHPDNTPAAKTMTVHQIAACHNIIDYCDGVVRWGGTYTDPDAMHWEINVPPGSPKLPTLVQKIIGGNRIVKFEAITGKLPELIYGDSDTIGGTHYVTRAQLMLDYLVPAKVEADGEYGAVTRAAVKTLMKGGTGSKIDTAVWKKLYAIN